ncbi:hypothetical protein LSG31_16660 [Fodinisporobacter ferrooxydans]|uniref:CopG family transcriptional regulator n=1 Tax=Fodinisporobacter ferrooxydans TaxID=2901836 RepID=A0ABY4CHL4_9BACL|nr:hypothetical protein LSG31_16660 [Alicyclobacillaceae bacterium MYW30-H2]
MEIIGLIKEEFDAHVATIKDADSDVRRRIEFNPELLKSLERAEKDIENGDFYTTEEILDMIDRG